MGLLKWLGKRAKERSTYVGVATAVSGIAVAAGKPEIAAGVDQYLPLVLALVGGLLIAKPAPEPEPDLFRTRS